MMLLREVISWKGYNAFEALVGYFSIGLIIGTVIFFLTQKMKRNIKKDINIYEQLIYTYDFHMLCDILKTVFEQNLLSIH
jgi:uncharacterized membrane protein